MFGSTYTNLIQRWALTEKSILSGSFSEIWLRLECLRTDSWKDISDSCLAHKKNCFHFKHFTKDICSSLETTNNGYLTQILLKNDLGLLFRELLFKVYQFHNNNKALEVKTCSLLQWNLFSALDLLGECSKSAKKSTSDRCFSDEIQDSSDGVLIETKVAVKLVLYSKTMSGSTFSPTGLLVVMTSTFYCALSSALPKPYCQFFTGIMCRRWGQATFGPTFFASWNIDARNKSSVRVNTVHVVLSAPICNQWT